jgi:hypothetical protein
MPVSSPEVKLLRKLKKALHLDKVADKPADRPQMNTVEINVHDSRISTKALDMIKFPLPHRERQVTYHKSKTLRARAGGKGVTTKEERSN